ncbi:Uncharacterised protein [Mycobacteroides abscessus]|nr:Uncharacterised protein [Mycobacteroides abscessus]
MRDQKYGAVAFTMHFTKQFKHISRGLGIQITCRFIGQ